MAAGSSSLPSSSTHEESLRGHLTNQLQIFQQPFGVLLIHPFHEHRIHGFAQDASGHLILHCRHQVRTLPSRREPPGPGPFHAPFEASGAFGGWLMLSDREGHWEVQPEHGIGRAEGVTKMLLSVTEILDASDSRTIFWEALRVGENREHPLRWSIDVNRLVNGCHTDLLVMVLLLIQISFVRGILASSTKYGREEVRSVLAYLLYW